MEPLPIRESVPAKGEEQPEETSEAAPPLPPAPPLMRVPAQTPAAPENLPGAPASAPARAPAKKPFEGAQALQETGPFAKAAPALGSSSGPGGQSKVLLTDAAPPAELAGSAEQRALGTRPASAPATNYVISAIPGAAGAAAAL